MFRQALASYGGARWSGLRGSIVRGDGVDEFRQRREGSNERQTESGVGLITLGTELATDAVLGPLVLRPQPEQPQQHLCLDKGDNDEFNREHVSERGDQVHTRRRREEGRQPHP